MKINENEDLPRIRGGEREVDAEERLQRQRQKVVVEAVQEELPGDVERCDVVGPQGERLAGLGVEHGHIAQRRTALQAKLPRASPQPLSALGRAKHAHFEGL